MTDPTSPHDASLPPVPLAYQAPSPAPRWPGYVAWAVILLAILFVLASNTEPSLKGRKATVRQGTSDVQLGLAGKYAIGTKVMASGSTTQPAISPAEIELVMQQVDTLAQTPTQQIHAAIVAGELQNSDAAVKRLDQIVDPSAEERQDIEELKLIYASGSNALTAEQQSRLVSRHDYLGRVAVTYNLPSSDPQRRAVLDEARHVVLLMLTMGIGVGIGGLLGVALLVAGIVLLATGTLRKLYTRQSGAGTVYLEMFAVYLVSYLGLSLLLGLAFKGTPPLAASWALAAVLPITVGWAMLRGRRWSEIRQALGWHGGRGWFIEMPLGLVGYLAGLPIIVIGFTITALLVRFSGATPSHPILSEAASRSPFHIVFLYSIASLWAPIIEETMFRGALFHHIRSRWNWLISAGVVALIFAVIHPQGWTTIPALASVAIVLAAIREWRGSILASMTAHGFHNAALVTLLILVL